MWTTKWLKLSGTMLVSVILDVNLAPNEIKRGPWRRYRTNEKIAKVLKLFADVKISRRLRRLDIRSVSIAAFRDLMGSLCQGGQLNAANFPHLNRLALCPLENQCIRVEDSSSMIPPDPRWDILQRFPSLRKLTLSRMFPLKIDSPLTSLTIVVRLGYEDAKMLFSSFPHLAHLVLPNLQFYPRESQPNIQDVPPIFMPSLRSLALDIQHMSRCIVPNIEDMVSPFVYMNIPSLQSLEVSGGFDFDHLFGSCLSDSLTTIKKMRLEQAEEVKLKKSVKYLQALHSLEELELIGVDVNAAAFFENSQDAWPKLQSLTLDTYDTRSLLCTIDFIETRKSQPVSELKTFILSPRWTLKNISEASTSQESQKRFREKGGKEWLKVNLEVQGIPAHGL
ncbi:hypothetical protein CVT26_009662 [Gymnopilus dilepis]|uniref:F-box domain-containing protein n=1 Tax=Gymnopilus dilepis TaxID=231916 RepID=A0A409VKM2_9AGAR|nr:hypothetical protein CVT26_009662 [Gymnopilus dilepis]